MPIYIQGLLFVFEKIAQNFLLYGRVIFLWFLLYSFIGWFYESTICSQVKYRKFINRGYLKGPICPIYGAGAVCNFLLIGWIDNWLVMFVAAAVISGLVEYATSYAMEKMFQKRWWDYTRYRFNINGRVCLYGCIIFGAANVSILKLLHPWVMKVTAGIPDILLTKISVTLYILLLIDIIYTTLHMETVQKKVEKLGQKLQTRKEYYRVRFEEAWNGAGVFNRPFRMEFSARTRLKEINYRDIIERIKEKLRL